jgi:hypothetical protein
VCDELAQFIIEVVGSVMLKVLAVTRAFVGCGLQ